MSYIKTIYNKKEKAYTFYPFQLCEYLCNRLGLNKNSELLEVGCGRCDFLRVFSKLGFKVSAIDKERVEEQEEFKMRYINVENESFPFKENSFDVIFTKSLIEHLNSPDNFMKECYRVLKPKGKIIIMTPNFDYMSKMFYEDYTHKRPYLKQTLRDLLKIFNFKNVEVELFYQYPLCWKFPFLKYLKFYLPIKLARYLTKITGIKYFRWTNETMILGVGERIC